MMFHEHMDSDFVLVSVYHHGVFEILKEMNILCGIEIRSYLMSQFHKYIYIYMQMCTHTHPSIETPIIWTYLSDSVLSI